MQATKVTIEQVKQMRERGEALALIDSRSTKAWESSDVKIAGAIRVPPDQVEPHLGKVPRDRPVVTYCT